MGASVAVAIGRPSVAVETGLTVRRLRLFVASTLEDAELQTYLDAARDAVDDAAGPTSGEQLLRAGSGPILSLSRSAGAILSVVDDYLGDELELAADDYRLSPTGGSLLRLANGTHPARRWCGHVLVRYAAPAEAADRIRAIVALVRLDLAFRPGAASETIGTWSESYRSAPYAEQRAEILASVGDAPVLVA